jgi:hypothetical protein
METSMPMKIARKARSCKCNLYLFRIQAFHAVQNARATKGVGITQPTKWQDAGLALGHKELEDVYMPKGEASVVTPPGAMLMYNEVRDRDETFLR